MFAPGTVLNNAIFSDHLTFVKKILIKLHAPAIRMDLLRLIISLLSTGVLQSLALENNMVWQATTTSKMITQMHNTIWTIKSLGHSFY
jgi:hypothetical protein